MIPSICRIVLLWHVVFVSLAATQITVCLAADSPAAQRLKAEVQRKQAETKRKIEQQSREIKAAHDRNSQQTLADMAKTKTALNNKPVAAPFDADNAPPPAECLKAFIAAAKNASSMEPVLPYLPVAK